jgi:hypothetical protein
VQALGSAGQVLGTSQAVAMPPHTALYGQSGFVSPSGVGGLPVGCFTGSLCDVTTKISVGHTVIATTGPKFVEAAAEASSTSSSPQLAAQY